MNPYNSVFISQNVPAELVKQFSVSQAANNFCLRINDLGYFSYHIAVPPANVDGSFNNHYDDGRNIEYHTCRKIGHRGVGRIINVLLDNIWLYGKVSRRKEKKIWYYNVWTGNILSFLMLKYFSTKRLYILLADYNPSRYSPFERKWILFALRNCQGGISLSARCSFVNKNFRNIAGIVRESDIDNIKDTPQGKSFLLSGTLNKNTGIDLALKVFKNIPQANLYISGSLQGEYVDMVKAVCMNHKNIKYMGYFERYDEYLHFFKGIDYVLNLRNPKSDVNKFNFPSKILEAMSKGKTIISTMSYPEMDGLEYYIAPYDENGFRNFIIKLIEKTDDRIGTNREKNANYLRSHFSEIAWIKAFEEIEKQEKK